MKLPEEEPLRKEGHQTLRVERRKGRDATDAGGEKLLKVRAMKEEEGGIHSPMSMGEVGGEILNGKGR